MKVLKTILFIILVIFAVIGMAFTAVFFGMRLGIFNVRGAIGERNTFFTQASASTNTDLVVAPAPATNPCTDSVESVCDWNQTTEWQVVKGGLEKDLPVIARVSAETGVPPRMIAAVVVPEQTRFFTANREVFKRYFEPLKILGSLSQFSLGVSGIKEDTAKAIEAHASDPTSPFYPGSDMTALFTYATTDVHDTVLFNRLTDAHDHYYQYLYTALFIKEVEAQWQRAGYDISDRPDVIVTIFNIGFGKSVPKADPQSGGAVITSGGHDYTYGDLGGLFYASDELPDLLK